MKTDQILFFFSFNVVGNKADLCDQRVISYEQGYEYASMVGALFCETSAITDKGKNHNKNCDYI